RPPRPPLLTEAKIVTMAMTSGRTAISVRGRPPPVRLVRPRQTLRDTRRTPSPKRPSALTHWKITRRTRRTGRTAISGPFRSTSWRRAMAAAHRRELPALSPAMIRERCPSTSSRRANATNVEEQPMIDDEKEDEVVARILDQAIAVLRVR